MSSARFSYDHLLFEAPRVSVHVICRPSRMFPSRSKNLVSISRIDPRTLKLSVFEWRGTNPCAFPFVFAPQLTTSRPLLVPSAAHPFEKSSTIVTHTLYSPPGLGVSL